MIITFVGIGMVSPAQTWRELTLPEHFERILFAGDPLETGHLALWGISSVVESSDQREELWVCYLSSDAGNTWWAIDAGRYTGRPDSDPWTALSIRICDGKIIRTSGYYTRYGECRIELSDRGRRFKQIALLELTDFTSWNDPEIYFAGDGSLYRSFFDWREEDWRRDSLNLAILRLAPPDTIWTLEHDTSTGSYRCPQGATPRCLSFDFQHPHNMTIGTDRGMYMWSPDHPGWKRKTTATPLDSAGVNNIMQHPADPGVWYAIPWGSPSFGGGVYRSVDSGESWTSISSRYLRDVALSHRDSRLLAGTMGVRGQSSDSVFLSADRGTTWTNITGNLNFKAGYYSRMYLDSAPSGHRLYLPTTDRVYVYDQPRATTAEPVAGPRGIACAIHPQPLRAGATAVLTIPVVAGENVRAEMFDVLGRSVALLHTSCADVSGVLSVPIPPFGDGCIKGTYIVRVEAGTAVDVVPLIVE